MRTSLLACLGLVGLAGCPDVKTDTNEGGSGPVVQFDPANSIVPFPNNLVLDPATGKVNLPQQCNEGFAAALTRQQVLNKLDGFGNYESALQVTFSEPVDMATLDQRVLLFQRTHGMTPIDPTSAQPIPVQFIIGKTTQYTNKCATSAMVDAVTIIPQGALEQHSAFDVALLSGIKTASGTDFGSTFTWALVDQADAPVTLDDQGNVTFNRTPLDPRDMGQLAQLQGIAQLWNAHKSALDFLDGAGHHRGDVILAWEFTTQTTTDPLDANVPNSPANMIAAAPLQGTTTILPAGVTAAQFLTNQGLPCGTLPCDKVGDILLGGLGSKDYQVDTSNPLSGGVAIPGAWSDPVHPAVVRTNAIHTLVAVPDAANFPPPWPVVVFGHGLGSSKNSMFAIAPQLAAQGFATVAIDFVDHGERAVRTSNDAALGCSGTVDPTVSPQCFAPILSAHLDVTRDNIRQTVLDMEALVAALKACGDTMCGTLKVDPAHIVYAGISLGGIIGTTTVASTPDIKAAVLNVPGVGLADVLENTQTLAIRCSLVDALIDAMVLTGDKYNPVAGTGLCTTDAWKAQPAYQQFAAIARWALDPADGANFTRKLAMRRFLIQEVVGDEVVPNIATDREGALVGLAPMTADSATSGAPLPSAAITTNPMMNKFVKYPTLPPAGAFPGNTFAHPSLLRPSKNGVAGTCGTPDCALGTARLQSDAITFLVLNK